MGLLVRKAGLAALLALALAAVVAPAMASASDFVPGESPAIVTGAASASSGSYLYLGGEEPFECQPPAFSTSQEGATDTLTSESTEPGSCWRGGGGGPMKMNGCKFTFESGQQVGPGFPGVFGSSFGGSFSIGPAGCGPVKVELPYCNLSISPGGGFQAEYANQPNGSEAPVRIHGTAEGLHFTSTGGLCPKEGTATYTPQWDLSATDEEGNPNTLTVSSGSAYISGEAPYAAPRVVADTYPTQIASDGSDSFSLTVAAGTVDCSSSTLSAEVSEETTVLPLAASLGGCISSGELPTVVSMHSCHFTLGVQNAGPPYAGTLGVECSEEGDAIEVAAYLGEEMKTRLCTIEIGSQSGQEGVGLANVFSPDTGIELDASVEGLAYKQRGLCGKAERSDGALSGTATLFGVG